MSTADFRMTGSVSGAHPSGTAGIVVAGETLTLQLEASPGLDIESVVFSIVVADGAGAPAIVLTPVSGIPTPTPLSEVTLVVPAGVRAYAVHALVNGGIDKVGQVRPEWSRTRVFYTVTAVNTRKLTPGETTEGDPTYGWTKAFNDLVDAQGGGDMIGPGASEDNEVLIASGVTGKVLKRSPAKIVDLGADTPAFLPHVAGKAMFVGASDVASGQGAAAYFQGGASGDDYGGDARVAGGTGSAGDHRGNVLVGYRYGDARPTRYGAAKVLEIANVGAVPAAGAPDTTHSKVWSRDGFLEAYGAWSAGNVRLLAKIEATAVVDNELATYDGIEGVVQGAGLKLTAGLFETTAGVDLLTLDATVCTFHVGLALGNGAAPATGALRLPDGTFFYGKGSGADAQLLYWENDVLALGSTLCTETTIAGDTISVSSADAAGVVMLSAGANNSVAVSAATDVTTVGGATGVALQAAGSDIVTVAADGASQFGVRLTDHGIAYAMAVGALTP